LAAEISPVVRRRRLAHELRELRYQAGLTLDDAAARLADFSAAKISRIETTRIGVRPRDVEALLDVYGLDDPQRRRDLVTLTQESRQRGWWETFSDAISPGEDQAIGLEGEAVSIRIFSAYFVDILFQTETYARELLRESWMSESWEHIDRRVKLRMARQRIFEQRDGLKVRAVFDETVLTRPVGGHESLREQLGRLNELAQLPNVSIQVLPLSAGAHPGNDGSFRIIELPPPDSSVVHLQHARGAVYMEVDEEIRLYSDCFRRLQYLSMTAKQSTELIKRLAE
jgi:transcriptional regulator with XRE-family HTH domain